MTEYKVIADELIGLKGAKYPKGSIVTENLFSPNHMKPLGEAGLVEKVFVKKEAKSSGNKS